MQTRATQTELLVPPRRLGQLLATARVQSGYSLEEATDALGSSWSPLALLEVETGHRPVVDRDLALLTTLYGIPTTNLIPARSHLLLDLDEGRLEVGDRTATLEGDSLERRDVLARYLSMVYAMRDVNPGQTVPLRLPDLEILSGVLGAPRRQVEDELHELMVRNPDLVSARTRRLKGRLLVPVLGVLVAVTAVGTLLLVNDSDAADVSSTGGAPATTVVESPTAPAGEVPTEIGDAVVQERLPDGSPGPVETRD
jgi:transcriptional regulator with XRE-family HTH domain